jgi:carbon-monoxide dehydrogenase medium subunit
VGVAARLALDEAGTCARAAIAVTGVTDKAYRASRVEQMLTGKKLDEKIIGDAAAEGTRNVEVIEDINGSSEYRSQLTRVYIARAIEMALKS